MLTTPTNPYEIQELASNTDPALRRRPAAKGDNFIVDVTVALSESLGLVGGVVVGCYVAASSWNPQSTGDFGERVLIAVLSFILSFYFSASLLVSAGLLIGIVLLSFGFVACEIYGLIFRSINWIYSYTQSRGTPKEPRTEPVTPCVRLEDASWYLDDDATRGNHVSD